MTMDAGMRGARNRGMTLIEVMVALFVMSIAMLGIAGLQVSSKRANFEAVQRTTAVMLAQNLIERMRANAGELTVYTDAGAGRTIALIDADNISTTDCAGSACDAATLAMYDLYEFRQALAGVAEVAGSANTGGLTEPTVCITGAAAKPTELTLAIAWRGLTQLSNPTINSCGEGSGRYGEDGSGDAYRRVLVLDAYVD